ncbi:MAG: phenylalanine--tRNA ligase subunit alpha [Candidatus Coatesbacteria bacterium]|nr:phenylalanine--tRNA ligase subunit alpha [Candidatus Coatesbacteria bacterium]
MKIDELKKTALDELKEVLDGDSLNSWYIKYLGKKGEISSILKSLGSLSPEERSRTGQIANETKNLLNSEFARKKTEIQQIEIQSKLKMDFDLTMLSSDTPFNIMSGTIHPVTSIKWEIEEIFIRMGFTIEEGPEVESEYYNFDALNTPSWHPARDMQDTFWLTDGRVLRTQTSAVQVRTMEKFVEERRDFPLMSIVPGRCFRYETIDPSHENTFYQIEGLMVGEKISIANLICTMKILLKEVFKRDVKTRLRPGYFPFVEPGFELDINCEICNGQGCPTCKQSGWLELLPCGMVHPNVLKSGRIDNTRYTGFAFGLGLTRLAMMKYGIDDIRYLNSGDLRVLKQFRKVV